MSSTKRGSKKRSPLDFYRTPAWCVRALMHVCPDLMRVSEIYDPACGDGAILKALRDMPSLQGLLLYGSDIDPAQVALTEALGFRAEVRDYIAPDVKPDCFPAQWRAGVVMNPPYSHAEEFIRRAVADGKRRRPVAALLSLAFQAGQSRSGWLEKDAPDVLVLPKRPDFTGEGGDSTDFAWMIWPAGPARVYGTTRTVPLYLCAETPEEAQESKELRATMRAKKMAEKAAKAAEAAEWADSVAWAESVLAKAKAAKAAEWEAEEVPAGTMGASK